VNIALIGYGKMGKVVECLAKERGIKVTTIIDPQAKGATHKEICNEALEGANACIDFSQPDAALENIKKVAEAGKEMVVATTGWYNKLDEAKKIVEKAGTGCIYSPNFSIGVNAFLKIVENAAGLFNSFQEYDVFAFEAHHKGKKDSPSGTAKRIAEILLQKIDRKKKLETDRLDRQIKEEELHFASVRGGSVPGTHSVFFDSGADSIELTHCARNREGFAAGALKAAEWIQGKKGFYSIDDMVKEIIK